MIRARLPPRGAPLALDEEIDDALAGCAAPLQRLCAYFQPQVLEIAVRAVARGRIDVDPRDVAQEIWCRLLHDGRRRLRYFCPGRGAFGPFLRSLARQQAVAILREARRRAAVPAHVHDDHPRASLATVDDRLLIQRALDSVRPPPGRVEQALLLEVVVGTATVRQLARRLGLSDAALYKRQQRLQERLVDAGRRLSPPCAPIRGRPLGPITRATPGRSDCMSNSSARLALQEGTRRAASAQPPGAPPVGAPRTSPRSPPRPPKE
ncbi:MAG: sigma-70 family RNA polymerase sigma factor [Myxococcales bacterium]|nr:sigma-70 family RNA polymerase sigma factor [Myxococcales bacterium]MCB9712382.1 sigma-70 family RNA polymerase sigma factor [Myxococcales bacterium]